MIRRGMRLSFFRGLAFYLFFRLSSLLLSLPAWVLLILHFTVDISIWWFIGYIILWFAVGILRYLLIIFARRSAQNEKEEMDAIPNKNPYSRGNGGSV